MILKLSGLGGTEYLEDIENIESFANLLKSLGSKLVASSFADYRIVHGDGRVTFVTVNPKLYIDYDGTYEGF